MKAIRTGVTSDDSSYPEVGTGQSFVGADKITFYPSLSTGGAATFTVVFEAEGEYYPCLATTRTGGDQTPFSIDIPEQADVNCYITGITGTIGIGANDN